MMRYELDAEMVPGSGAGVAPCFSKDTASPLT